MLKPCSAFLVLIWIGFCPVASAQLPTVESGGTVSVYATFPTDPGEISFDANDNLFVGNFNNPGPPNGPAVIWVIDPVDSLVTTCATVDDPDALFVDRNGLISSPGSILVGGYMNATNTGQIVAVAPGCGGISPIGSGGCIGNVHMFAEDSLGRLFITNATELTVCMWDGVSWSQFLPPASDIPRIAIDGTDIYVSEGGTVRRYDSSGALVDSLFATGVVYVMGPPGTVFEGLIVARDDLLVAINTATKAETRILAGPGATGHQVAFDSVGDLYISQGGEFDRILHVTQGSVSAAPNESPSMDEFQVSAAPNPFNAHTVVRYQLKQAATVTLKAYDLSGRSVRTLLASSQDEAGHHEVHWDGRNAAGQDLPSGIYLLRLNAGGEESMVRVSLIK